jgi:RNA polymerase sigma-54 factor
MKGRSAQIQTQGQQMQQTQSLSPLQVLIARLLQLTTVEMEERVRGEVIENPALDEAPDADAIESDADYDEGGRESDEELIMGDYSSEDDIPDYKLNGLPQSTEQQAYSYATTQSFYDYLLDQLHEQPLTEQQTAIGEYIIGSLDEDGLLHKPLLTLADELAIYHDIDVEYNHIEEVLHIIQQFDPAGLGARNLQECLLLQLERKECTPSTMQQKRLLKECFDEFTHKRWDKIEQKLGWTASEVSAAVAELVRLNPRPGSAFGESVEKSTGQIVPDFIVETYDDSITMSLNNSNIPHLRVSQDFMQMLDEQSASSNADSRNAAQFLKQKIEAAREFINAVQQRERTLTLTMQAIIDLQRPFFLEGDESLLRPLILKDVAEKIGLDISTISRATIGKYVQTNYGIFPLRYFFSDGIANTDGEEVSIKEVHNLLRELVDGEDKTNPYTDEQLVTLLAERGFIVARRTISKYREQLHIPIARMRK